MGTEEDVAKMIISRANFGREKYGVSVDRADLSISEWLTHAQEEALDLAVYLQRAKREVRERPDTLPSLFVCSDLERCRWAQRNIRRCFIACNVRDASAMLFSYNGEWDSIYLHYDADMYLDILEEARYSGMELVREISEHGQKVQAKRFVCYSMGDLGRNLMVEKLTSMGYNVESIPFSRMDQLS